ncbi:MAG TPA: hypothetical protein VFT22_33750 [Kofleriaceae bacterium]|nr:hypothetical protein [Kofleriaceae bacterium]
MNPSFSADEVLGLEGPDYVALVIEWDDNGEPTTVSASAPQASPGSSQRLLARKIATVLGAVGAVALAVWGIRRLRAAL